MSGASYLTVPVPQAFPTPPDIATLFNCPGGQLLPCTPEAGTGTIANRSQYRLSFPFGQGAQLAIRRIHLAIPVYLQEQALEKTTVSTSTVTGFSSEAEANEALNLKPPLVEVSGEIIPITPTEPYQTVEIERKREKPKVFGPNQLREVINTKTSRSVLPITVGVVARIIGPDDELWSQSFDVPLHYVQGEPGKALGTGNLDAYADLTNELLIDPSKLHTLALFVYIPTLATVTTNTQLGPEIIKGTPIAGTTGNVTLFYDVEPVPVGK